MIFLTRGCGHQRRFWWSIPSGRSGIFLGRSSWLLVFRFVCDGFGVLIYKICDCSSCCQRDGEEGERRRRCGESRE